MNLIRIALKGNINNFYALPSQNEINKMLASISSKIDVNRYAPSIKSRLFDYEIVRKAEIERKMKETKHNYMNGELGAQSIHQILQSIIKDDENHLTTPHNRRTMSAPNL